jgi:hypothetical protein
MDPERNCGLDRATRLARISRGRKAVQEVQATEYISKMCGASQPWSFSDSSTCGLYPRRSGYGQIHGLGSFEPYLSRIGDIEPKQMDAFARETRSGWCGGQSEHCYISSKNSTKGGASFSEPWRMPGPVTSHLFPIGAAGCCRGCPHHPGGPRRSFIRRMAQISRSVARL